MRRFRLNCGMKIDLAVLSHSICISLYVVRIGFDWIFSVQPAEGKRDRQIQIGTAEPMLNR